MSFDYNPNIENLTGIKTFRFWCQKTMPLVYDDSLSYYELLCKVVDYINSIIGDMSKLGENDKQLLTAYNQLKDFVNNYFDSLDLSTEINSKLDEMYANGDFDEITSRLVEASPVLSAKVLGITPENSAEENYANLTNYLNLNNTGGYTLYFPAGTYEFSDYINIPSDVNIVGDGNKTILTNKNYPQGIFKISANNISIKNLTLYDQESTSIKTEQILSSNEFYAGIIIWDRENPCSNIQIENVYTDFKLGLVISAVDDDIKDIHINGFYGENSFIQVRKEITGTTKGLYFNNINICGLYCSTIKNDCFTTISNSKIRYIDYGLYPLNICNTEFKALSSAENSSWNIFDSGAGSTILKSNVVNCCNASISNCVFINTNPKTYQDYGVMSLMDTDYYTQRPSIILISNSRFIDFEAPYTTSNYLGYRTQASMVNSYSNSSLREAPMVVNPINPTSINTINNKNANIVRKIDTNTYELVLNLKIVNEFSSTDVLKSLGSISNLGGSLLPADSRNLNGYIPCTISYRTNENDVAIRTAYVWVDGGHIQLIPIADGFPFLPNTSQVYSPNETKVINIQASGMIYNYYEVNL